jgi:hypothetical protein
VRRRHRQRDLQLANWGVVVLRLRRQAEPRRHLPRQRRFSRSSFEVPRRRASKHTKLHRTGCGLHDLLLATGLMVFMQSILWFWYSNRFTYLHESDFWAHHRRRCCSELAVRVASSSCNLERLQHATMPGQLGDGNMELVLEVVRWRIADKERGLSDHIEWCNYIGAAFELRCATGSSTRKPTELLNSTMSNVLADVRSLESLQR